jgi:hypothetical protein
VFGKGLISNDDGDAQDAYVALELTGVDPKARVLDMLPMRLAKDGQSESFYLQGLVQVNVKGISVHYTPTSCSWLNAVEGFFAKLTRRRLKRGVFRSIVELQAAINRFLRETNDDPKPFTWTADLDKIVAAVKRGHQVLASIHVD